MSEDFIPLMTDDFKLAFCQSTNYLCNDVQMIIWKHVLITEPKCPDAPKKQSPGIKNILRKIESI